MLHPKVCVDDVTELLVRVREDLCPNCLERQSPPELIEMLDCECHIPEGRLKIKCAQAIMEKLDAA